MRHLLLAALLCIASTGSGRAQNQNASAGPGLESTLTFEVTHNGAMPAGWGGGPPGTVFVDGDVVHGGRWAARLERTATSPQAASALTSSMAVDFAGTTIEWRGFLRSENVGGYMALFVGLDGDMAPAFASLEPRQIKGTNDWAEYSITLPLDRQATSLSFGVLLSGTGKVWADDLRLLIDGTPVWEAPKAERPKTPLELDHQFDSGSGIVISELSPMQIEHLATLGKVWGFLKYHHPAVTSGTRHWDYDLFRLMPAVLAARSREAAEGILRVWIQQLGSPPPCEPCATPGSEDLHFGADLRWIDTRVGPELAGLLRTIHRGRSQSARQFYVRQVVNVGHPVFERDLAYATLTFPDAGFQLLGLYRFWNIVEYWFPYRDLLDESWDRVLAEFIPRIALAKDKDAYQLEMLAFIAKVTDTHANLNAPAAIRPPAGGCQLPVITRFIENQVVVTGYSNATTGPATGLQIGDVIDTLDGARVPDLVTRWEPYYPASNQPTRLRDMARSLTRGACSVARVGVRRPAGTTEITAQRQPFAALNLQAGSTHDLTGDTFRLLSDQVAYLKLSSIQTAQAASYIERSRGTRGLIIDIRNYPAEFVVFALGSLFVDRPTPFARFTAGDLGNPGAFRWTAQASLTPLQPHYAGKVVVLVDEISVSLAEYTTMALRAAPQTIVVGSTTAGADGNVSPIVLPGGLRTAISGVGIFYPDKRPTQRIGIVPDVEVRPTIAGIRDGRDEVLEEAVRQIVGRDVPAAEIRSLAAPTR